MNWLRKWTRGKPKSIVFLDAEGKPLSIWAVRAGMLVTATDYDHGQRKLTCWLAPREGYVPVKDFTTEDDAYLIRNWSNR